ncbi:MAG: mannose-1-phosphate guanylyltransferase [Anaerolineae bacterium]|nr:mannose-1-phosphate guanylyltransferase [Anaerolineae bacterium]
MTADLQHFYALIMAGGGGTRLWPLSRKAQPKQMLVLTDEQQSMFQLTVRRLQPLLNPDRIFVVTGQDMVAQLREETPEIPAENYIIEPYGRNSGPAAALGSMVITERDPEAIIATLSADHHIANTERFRQVLTATADIASQGMIVTLGISPSRPAVEFGYIKRGEEIGQFGGFTAYQAEGFTEKPNLTKAAEFVLSGLYSWNSGMFIWPGRLILAEYQRQQPAIYEPLMAIRAALGAEDFAAQIKAQWDLMPSISLDYAVMEGAPSIAVIPVDIGWSDIGSWDLLYEVLPTDTAGNTTRGKGPDCIQVDTTNTLIISDRLVVTIGVDDLVVIDTHDALLVCHRSQAQAVREVVRQLREKGAESYL